MSKCAFVVFLDNSSVEEILESITRLIRLLIDDLDFALVKIFAPVLLNAHLHEIVHVPHSRILEVICIEVGPSPDIARLFLSEFFARLLTHAKDQHCLGILEVFEVKDSDRRICVRIVVEFGLEVLLLSNLVLVFIHLLHHSVTNRSSVFRKLYKSII